MSWNWIQWDWSWWKKILFWTINSRNKSLGGYHVAWNFTTRSISCLRSEVQWQIMPTSLLPNPQTNSHIYLLIYGLTLVLDSFFSISNINTDLQEIFQSGLVPTLFRIFEYYQTFGFTFVPFCITWGCQVVEYPVQVSLCYAFVSRYLTSFAFKGKFQEQKFRNVQYTKNSIIAYQRFVVANIVPYFR